MSFYNNLCRPDGEEPVEIWKTQEDGQNRWQRIDLPIDEAQHGKKHTIEFEASYDQTDPLPYADIALDDISFSSECE